MFHCLQDTKYLVISKSRPWIDTLISMVGFHGASVVHSSWQLTMYHKLYSIFLAYCFKGCGLIVKFRCHELHNADPDFWKQGLGLLDPGSSRAGHQHLVDIESKVVFSRGSCVPETQWHSSTPFLSRIIVFWGICKNEKKKQDAIRIPVCGAKLCPNSWLGIAEVHGHSIIEGIA